MARPRREITAEQKEYLFRLGIDESSRNGRYYRTDFADMNIILAFSGHEVPDNSDYQELRKQRKNDTEFTSSKSRIEQYFQYKAETGRQINMFDNEATDTQGQNLAEVNSEATQPEAVIQDNNTPETTDPEAITYTVNAPESKQPAPMDKQELDSQVKISKRGRKPKEGNYTHRIMLYVSPELEAQISACCSALGTSITDFCVRILEKNVGKYEAELSKYLEQQKKIKSLFMN